MLLTSKSLLREAFKKKSVKFFSNVKKYLFFLKLDHYWGTFGKKCFFPLEMSNTCKSNPTVKSHCAIPLCNPTVQSHCAMPMCNAYVHCLCVMLECGFLNVSAAF